MQGFFVSLFVTKFRVSLGLFLSPSLSCPLPHKGKSLSTWLETILPASQGYLLSTGVTVRGKKNGPPPIKPPKIIRPEVLSDEIA